MLCLDTSSKKLVNCQGQLGYCQSAAVLDVYHNAFSKFSFDFRNIRLLLINLFLILIILIVIYC